MLWSKIKSESTPVKMKGGRESVCISSIIFDEILRCSIKCIEVDELWYLNRYEDVKQAIEEKLFDSARDHYTKHGYFENRLPRRIVVDEQYYLMSNPDVAAAVETGVFRNGQEHYLASGAEEGRLPFPNFSLFT